MQPVKDTDALLEKREYTDGTRYVPATSVQPGVAYYLQKKDEQGRDYYLNTNPAGQNAAQPSFAATSSGYPPQAAPLYQQTVSYQGAYQQQQPYATAYQSPYQNNANGPGAPGLYQRPRFGGIAAAHLIVTIFSLFIPFFYMIGFPIIYFVLHRHMHHHAISEDRYYAGKMSTYTALGWTTYALAVIGHWFCVFGWSFSTYCYWNNNNYNCYMNLPGFIVGIIGSVFTGISFFMILALCIVGALWIKA